MTYDEQAAMKYLMDLLPIPGPPGDEKKVQEYLVNACLELGVPRDAMTTDTTYEQSEYGGNTGNLYIHLDGVFVVFIVELSVHQPAFFRLLEQGELLRLHHPGVLYRLTVQSPDGFLHDGF